MEANSDVIYDRERVNENPEDILKQLREINADGGLDERFKVDKKPYEIKTMNDRHHEIVRLHAVGYKNTEIANQLKISKMSVSQVLNSPIVKLKLDTLRGQKDVATIEVLDKINDMLPDAVRIYEGIIAGGDVSNDVQTATLQLKAAKEALGLGGYSPVKQSINRNISATITSEDLKAMTADADKLGITQGDAIDVEYKEITQGESND